MPSDSRDDSDDDDGDTGIAAIGRTKEELQRLKAEFHDEDNQPRKLDRDEFVTALLRNRGRGRARGELCTLFQKIDASCTGAVNWEEFTDYMLWHMPGSGANEGACELAQGPQVSEVFAGGCRHDDMINCITVVNDAAGGGGEGGDGAGKSLRRYVTAARDGCVKIWHPNLTLHKTIDMAKGGMKSWLTACSWMAQSRRLAVASSQFKIHFFEGNTFNSTPVAHIDCKDGTPLCLGYITLGALASHESNGQEKEILMVGDHNGGVTVYPMDGDWVDQPHDKKKDLSFKTKPTRTVYHEGHWVTKVGFVTELQAMVTCGLDGAMWQCDLLVNQAREGRTKFAHKKGVHSWCWCKSLQFFATGGLDRQIVIWNPYTQKAVNFLQGHNASIIEVIVNENQHQLVSLSVDKVVKVWDIRNFRCMQTFTDKTEYKPEDRLTCMALDEEGPVLVLCSSSMNVLPVNVKIETSRTHLAPIIGALYNDVFHQIVSGDNLGTICVWDVRSGKLEFPFRCIHQDRKLTCMAFDETKRRLFTGAEDGMVKLWNFSSGQQLRAYCMPRPSELTGLLWAREGPNCFVVGLAWDRRIHVWPDIKKQVVEVQHTLEDFSGQGHNKDVSCICRYSHVMGHLATGGDDGYVIFWKIQEGSNAGSSRKYRLEDKGPSSGETRDGAAASASAAAAPREGPRTPGSQADRRGAAAKQPGAGAGKYGARSSVAADDLGPAASPAAAAPSASIGSVEVDAYDDLLEGLGFEDEAAGSGAAGVERMIFLEHKRVLLTTHTDRFLRSWSTSQAEFLHRLEFLKVNRAPRTPPPDPEPLPGGEPIAADGLEPPRERDSAKLTAPAPVSDGYPALVDAQPDAVTAIYAEPCNNLWLVTGDSEGWVRVWDLRPYAAQTKTNQHLLLQNEFRPHRQPVTQLQHFELDGPTVVMSASADCTIVLCTIEGQRIGTFGSKGLTWRLSDSSTWYETPPPFDELAPVAEADDGWSVSPRRGEKRPPGRPPPVGARPSPGGATGGRTPRAAKVDTRRATSSSAPSGHSIFKNLEVERFKPDLLIEDQEKAKQSAISLKQQSGKAKP